MDIHKLSIVNDNEQFSNFDSREYLDHEDSASLDNISAFTDNEIYSWDAGHDTELNDIISILPSNQAYSSSSETTPIKQEISNDEEYHKMLAAELQQIVAMNTINPLRCILDTDILQDQLKFNPLNDSFDDPNILHDPLKFIPLNDAFEGTNILQDQLKFNPLNDSFEDPNILQDQLKFNPLNDSFEDANILQDQLKFNPLNDSLEDTNLLQDSMKFNPQNDSLTQLLDLPNPESFDLTSYITEETEDHLLTENKQIEQLTQINNSLPTPVQIKREPDDRLWTQNKVIKQMTQTNNISQAPVQIKREMEDHLLTQNKVIKQMTQINNSLLTPVQIKREPEDHLLTQNKVIKQTIQTNNSSQAPVQIKRETENHLLTQNKMNKQITQTGSGSSTLQIDSCPIRKMKAPVKKIDLKAMRYIVEESEECDVDIETVAENSPVIEAGDIKTLLEQFEASEMPEASTPPVKFDSKETPQLMKAKSIQENRRGAVNGSNKKFHMKQEYPDDISNVKSKKQVKAKTILCRKRMGKFQREGVKINCESGCACKNDNPNNNEQGKRAKKGIVRNSQKQVCPPTQFKSEPSCSAKSTPVAKETRSKIPPRPVPDSEVRSNRISKDHSPKSMKRIKESEKTAKRENIENSKKEASFPVRVKTEPSSPSGRREDAFQPMKIKIEPSSPCTRREDVFEAVKIKIEPSSHNLKLPLASAHPKMPPHPVPQMQQKCNNKTTSIVPDSQARGRRILESLPRELLERMKESSKRKTISVIPPIPAKKMRYDRNSKVPNSTPKIPDVLPVDKQPQHPTKSTNCENILMEHSYCARNIMPNQQVLANIKREPVAECIKTEPAIFSSTEEEERAVIGKQPMVKNADGKLMVSLLKVNTIRDNTDSQKKKLNLDEYKKRRAGLLKLKKGSQNSSPESSASMSPSPEDDKVRLLKHQEKLKKMALELLTAAPKSEQKPEPVLVLVSPRPVKLPDHMESKTVVSIGTNTDFKIRNNLDPLAPVEQLEQMKPLLEKVSDKINTNSLITSVIENIPKVMESCEPPQVNGNNPENWENLTYVFQEKKKESVATVSVACQTNISIIQQIKASRNRTRYVSNSSSSSTSSYESKYNRERRKSKASHNNSFRSARSSRSSYSRSSSYSSRSSSRSRSRTRSRSPPPKYSRRDNEHLRQEVEDRRVIYIGRLVPNTTKEDLRRRFQRFGPITNISLHKRTHGDNYGFVTFLKRLDAFEALEHGNDDPYLPKYDLSFGGRRIFCNSAYSDLDNMRDDDGYHPSSMSPNNLTFDKLLQAAREDILKRQT